jgi:hypothetical protein
MYKIVIRNNETNEERQCDMEVEWGEYSMLWWTEGNMCCDCNRHLLFERAAGNEPDDSPCGDDKYAAVKAILEDGTEFTII